MKNLNKTTLIGLFVISMLMIGCEAAQFTSKGNACYSSGNYIDAVNNAVFALRVKPKHKNATALINKAYPEAIKKTDDAINDEKTTLAHAKDARTIEPAEKIVTDYKNLVTMIDNVKSLPSSITGKFEIKNYKPAYEDAKTAAAEAHYLEGDRLVALGGQDNSKNAAKHYKKCADFVPDYKDASTKYETARVGGVKRIAILAFDNKSGKTQFGPVGETVTDLIISKVMNTDGATEFLEIITRDQLDKVLQEQKLNVSGIVDESTAASVGQILGVHEILTGQITQLMTYRPAVIIKNYQDKRDIVLKQEKYMDNGQEKVRDIHGTVTADIVEHDKETSSKITGSYKIIDVKTGKLKKADTFTEEFKFTCQWATHQGDDRAMSSSTKKLVGQSEKVAPSDEEMVSNVIDKLANSLSIKIIGYAK